MSTDIYQCLQYLNNWLQHQQLQIQQLESQLKQLNEKNSSQPAIHNEYKFDLLKIERLEGTLNIGIRPDGNGADSPIEEIAVGQSMSVPSLTERQYPDLYRGIQKQVHEYLDNGAYQALNRLENQYQYPLDEPYRKFIVDDVKKQIDKRISHYVNQINMEDMPPEEAGKHQQPVFEKVKHDIERTFEAFLQNLPRKGDHS